MPSVLVTDLAAYNYGRYNSVRIIVDGDFTEDDFWNDVNKMLAESPISHAEEWEIHDYEGWGLDPRDFDKSEWGLLAQLAETYTESLIDCAIQFMELKDVEMIADNLKTVIEVNFCDKYRSEIALAQDVLYKECSDCGNELPTIVADSLDFNLTVNFIKTHSQIYDIFTTTYGFGYYLFEDFGWDD